MQPEKGMRVWYVDASLSAEPLGAFIADVHDRNYVTLTVLLPNGDTKPQTLVRLYPDTDDAGKPVMLPAYGSYAFWPDDRVRRRLSEYAKTVDELCDLIIEKGLFKSEPLDISAE